MKLTTSFLSRALVLRALAVGLLIGLIFGMASAQQPQVPEAEKQAALKIQTAADPTAQLQAASEFIKQFPKSTLRRGIAQFVAGKIDGLQDQAQKATLAENFSTVFTEANEKEIITPILLDAYLRANRMADAFRVAPTWLEKNPDDVSALTQMALSGIDQIRREGEKAKNLVAPSQQYATQAIALIEANKKPANLDETQWSDYKTRLLPALYQSLGIVALMSSNGAEAKAKLEKAASLYPGDPLNYALLGNLVDDEYQQLAMQHKDMPAGAAKDEKLKQAIAKMQQVVELYAQAIALAENKPPYQQLSGQVKPQLESYYKFLHDGSDKGLQELINKYKK
jgi:hypothetical protein